MAYRDCVSSNAALQNVASRLEGLAGDAAYQPPLSKLEAAASALLNIGDGLFTQIGRLESIGDKLLGAFPAESQKSGANPIANGDVERIEQNIASLSDMLSRLASAVQRLERL